MTTKEIKSIVEANLTPLQMIVLRDYLDKKIEMDAARPMRIKEYEAIALRAAEKAIGEPLLFGSRIKKHMYARCVIALYLRPLGLTYKEIAKTIKRHHSTVVFLLNQSSYMLGHPDVYPDFKVIYDNFLKATENETCMGLAAGER